MPDEVLVPGKWLEKVEDVLAFAEEFVFSDPALDPDFTFDSRRALYKALSTAVVNLMEYEHELPIVQNPQTGTLCSLCGSHVGPFRTLLNGSYCHDRKILPLLTCYEQEWVARSAG